MVRSRPSAAPFVLLSHWPIPWQSILSEDERHLGKLMCDYCLTFATSGERRSRYLHGFEWLYLHCHCARPKSLQCRSAGVFFQRLLKDCVLGTGFDRRFWFYRQELSKLSTVYLSYAGSVHINEVHLIYLTGVMRIDSVNYIKNVNWGEHLWVESDDTVYLVLICRSCSPLSEIRVNCCLRFTRKRLKRMVALLPDECKQALGLYKARDRHLERLARFGQPVLCDRYNASVSVI